MTAFAVATLLGLSRLEKVVNRLELAVRRGEVAGSVVLVKKGGKTLLHRAIGYADRDAGKKMHRDTLFQVMSMTKPVTAAAVMLCVEDGLLNLDDPVSKFLPSMKDVRFGDDKARPAPTILHLLTHTSGLDGNDPGGTTDEQKARTTLADYAQLIGTEPLRAQPGTEIRYSGVGISAAAAVVEKVTGVPFDQFVQARIFDPLGMKDTHFFLPVEKRPRLAQVYTGDVGSLKVFPNDRYREGAKFPNGAGGLYSTATDMAAFISSFLGPRTASIGWPVPEGGVNVSGVLGLGNPLLSPAATRMMTSIQTGDLPMDNGRERGFGLGWVITRRSPVGTTLRPAGSFGHTGAFGTEYWADSRSGTVAVFMAQTFGVTEDARKSFNTLVAAACCDE